MFSEHWSPKVVKRLNDYEINVVKIEGEFVWHAHQDNGELMMQLRDGNVSLNQRQLFIVRKGVEHCPIAREKSTRCSSNPPMSSMPVKLADQ